MEDFKRHISFLIKKGKLNSGFRFPRKLTLSSMGIIEWLDFTARLSISSIKDAIHNTKINKLYGYSLGINSDKNSVYIGWKHIVSKCDGNYIGFYALWVDDKGTRSTPLQKINVRDVTDGTFVINFKLGTTPDQHIVDCNGAISTLPRYYNKKDIKRGYIINPYNGINFQNKIKIDIWEH